MTICFECKFHLNKGVGTDEEYTWHQQYCTASKFEREKRINPVTGKLGYVSLYNLGKKSFSEEEQYPNCREVNDDGECSEFSHKNLLRIVK